MAEGSFSFLSFESQKYSNNPRNELQNGDSKYTFRDSIFDQNQGSKGPMSNKLEIVLLLQAAQIQRLTENLNIYRARFKDQEQFQKGNSSQPESTELIMMRQQLQTKNRRITQLMGSQSLSMISSHGSINDVNQYIQKIQNKYKRALKFIEEMANTRQEIQAAYLETKEQLIQTENTFESFKKTSIKEYQILRQEFQNTKRAQLSFEMRQYKDMVKRQESSMAVMKLNYDKLMANQKEKLLGARKEISKLAAQKEEFKMKVDRFESKYRDMSQQKENALVLAGMEIERLNSILKQKRSYVQENQRNYQQLHQAKIKAQEELSFLSRQSERVKKDNLMYQDEIDRLNSEISKLSSEITSLTSKISQMGIYSEEKNVEYKVREGRWNTQLRNMSQAVSNTEYRFQTQIEQYRSANMKLSRELSMAREEVEAKQEVFRKREKEITYKLQEIEREMQRVRQQLGTMVDKQRKAREQLRGAMSKGLIESQTYQRKLQSVTFESRIFSDKAKIQHEHELQELKRYYQQRLRQMQTKMYEYQQKVRHQNMAKSTLFSQNTSLKTQLQQTKKQSNNNNNKSVDHLFNQISTLCISIKQKDNHIDQLQFQLTRLNQSAHQSFTQILHLRQMLHKLTHLIQLFEENRKQDQKSLLGEMKRVVQGQSGISDSLKYATKHGQVQNYQSELLRGRDSEIRYLKEKMSYLESESMERSNVQEIVKKSVQITKQNLQLKNIIQKNEVQIQRLSTMSNNLKYMIQDQQNSRKILTEEKEQLQRQLRSQINNANNILFEQRQSQIKTQSGNLQLVSYKRFSEHQLAVRDKLIEELKDSLKLKNDQNLRVTLVMEEEVNLNRKLNDEINMLKKSYTHEIYQKRQELQISAQEFANLKKRLKDQEIERRNAKNELQTIKSQISFYKVEYEKNKNVLAGYNQKMPLLSSQFQRLERIVDELRGKNNKLLMKNHQGEIQVQRTRLEGQKNTVLSQQIMRLQAQNINLLQQLSICRLQLGQQSSQSQQLQQSNILLVLIFAQIQSLRSKLQLKDRQLQAMRRDKLGR